MKTERLFILLFVIAALTSSCDGTGQFNIYRDYSFEGIEPTFVEDVPEGYLPIKKIHEVYGDVINVDFLESQIAIFDLDNHILLQKSIANEDLLLQHKNDLYINAKEIDEILPLAEKTSEERNRIYSIGEVIETFDWAQRPVTITVAEISYVDNYDDIDPIEDEWICIIKINLKTEYDNEYFNKYNAAWNYFDHAETADGREYIDILQNEDNFEQIVFKLPKGGKVKYLYVKSPSLWETRRKVDISQ